MVLWTWVTRRFHLGRSGVTRIVLVAVFILWTVIVNISVFRRPEGTVVVKSDSAPPAVRRAVVAPPKWAAPQVVVQRAVPPAAPQPAAPVVAVQRSAPPAAVQRVVPPAVPQPAAPVVAVHQPAPPAAVQRVVPPAAPQPAAPVVAVHQPAPPAAVQRSASVATSSESHAPLSCFTDRSSPEQREFSESEKAIFRYLFDWPEVPTSTCKRMFKLGGIAGGEGCLVDGDKYVCLDAPLSLADAKDCLVYSFGINYDWSFDEAAEAFGCEVHSFDPSIDYPEGSRSPGITFHHFGIGRNNHTNIYGWQIYTLDQIVNLLGHQGRTIHYLKMDAEGGEFDMLTQQLLDGSGEFVLDKVEQIGFEVHYRLDPRLEMNGFYLNANESVHAMRELGFNMVKWEYNKVVWQRYMFPGVERPVSLLYEILLVKNGLDTWDRSQRGRR